MIRASRLLLLLCHMHRREEKEEREEEKEAKGEEKERGEGGEEKRRRKERGKEGRKRPRRGEAPVADGLQGGSGDKCGQNATSDALQWPHHHRVLSGWLCLQIRHTGS